MFRFLSPLPAFAAALLLSASVCMAQTSRPVAVDGRIYSIKNVSATFESTPKFPGPSGKTSRSRTQWMQIEAEFDVQPDSASGQQSSQAKPFVEQVELEIFALLSTAVSREEQAALVSGKTTLINVPVTAKNFAVMYISPRLLDMLFNGKVPATANGALVARDSIGAVLKVNGEVAATYPPVGGNAAPFWENLSLYRLASDVVRKVDGGVLPKWKTPFAFSNWDYYLEEKIGD